MGGRYVESTAKKSNQSKRLKSLASSGNHPVRLLSSGRYSVTVLSHFFHWPYWITGVLGIIWVIGSVISVYAIPKIRHRIWRYEVHENEIDIQSGIFIVKRVIVPMVRVQRRRYFTRPAPQKVPSGLSQNLHGGNRSFHSGA